MKTSSITKQLALALTLGGAAFAPGLFAQGTEVFIEGGSASSSIIYDRATNLFAVPLGGSFTFKGSTKANVVQFYGNSSNALISGYNPITLDINLNNGAVAGLTALVNGYGGPGDTNVNGTPLDPTFVDSATSPEAVEISSTANYIADLPTYVVPLAYAADTNWAGLAGITNLTQRQALSLETSTNQAAFYGGTGTNVVYFVGRNVESAVRTELDYNIYNTSGAIITYSNNAAGQPVEDGSLDPGYTSASALVTAIETITNSIGTLAIQNIKPPLAALAYEGVNYSVTNVINGSYPLWGYEHYYYINGGGNSIVGTPQQAILNVFYNSVTNAAYQSPTNPIFGNNYVPIPALQVTRDFDGAQITGLGNY